MAQVTLTVVQDEMEAEMLCGLLHTNGIPCYYRRSDVASGIAAYAPGVSMAGPTEVIVEDRDLAKARELLPPPVA